MKTPKSIFGWLLVALSLTACSLIEGEKTTIRLKGVTSLTPRDEAVIITRLGAFSSALKPSYRIVKDGNAMLIEAKGAPPEEMAAYLLSHHGVFSVKSESGAIWFSEQDIIDVVVGFNDQQVPVINFRVSPAAAERVSRLSSQDVGKTVSAVLDNELLAAAAIAGPIPEGRLQLSLRRPANEVQLIAAILKSGALSVTPESIRFQK